jgi:hypothetical protein
MFWNKKCIQQSLALHVQVTIHVILLLTLVVRTNILNYMHTVHNLEMACWDILEPKYIISITQKKIKKTKLLTVTELTTLSLFNLLLSLFFIFLFFQFSCKIIIINSNSWLSRKKIWLLKRYCLFLHFKNIFNKI